MSPRTPVPSGAPLAPPAPRPIPETLTAPDAHGLVGVWTLDEGYQLTELLFRSDGRYQLDTNSTASDLSYSLAERGHCEVHGQSLTLIPYEFLGQPDHKVFQVDLTSDVLTLVRQDYELTYVYQFRPGSTDDVLARQQVAADLVGTWIRDIPYSGTEAYTFRPDGYFFCVHTPEDTQFPPEIVRGRYTRTDAALTVSPYSGTDANYEIDFFGTTLTLVTAGGFSVQWNAYECVPGSPADVRARTEAAQAFLDGESWQVGVWEIREGGRAIDLTLRPDGHYVAQELTGSLAGIVRGRYQLEPRQITLSPFDGQEIYARSNGDFGKVARTRAVDFFDGELQLVDLGGLSQSVTLARLRSTSTAAVLALTAEAQAIRARDGWQLGTWNVEDPAGWMDFTFRPDGRYLVRSGRNGVPTEVERGRYRLTDQQLTLAPYAGQGAARGFELDLYAGELGVIGDAQRLVIARQVPGSAAAVVDQTVAPVARQGERGGLLGRWSADLPGQSAELVFRPDGQFRLSRCDGRAISQDYGLYRTDPTPHTLVSDSRFTPVQTLGLDFYGDTLTLYGGTLGPPRTYVVQLGTVDAAIAASLAADAREAEVDATWLPRVPIGPRDPAATSMPTADLPADPRPAHVFDGSEVVTGFAMYRRLSPGFVYFNDWGTIRSVPVVNTQEWYFFRTGRVLVRFRTYHAGFSYPNTTVAISDTWGAYRVEPRPAQRDILHVYADNVVRVETDGGEQVELTLEDGRRTLFWGKDQFLLLEWATERTSVPCAVTAQGNPSLMNTGVSLRTSLAPVELPDETPAPLPEDPTPPPDDPAPPPPDGPVPPPTDNPVPPPTDEPVPVPAPGPGPQGGRVALTLAETALGDAPNHRQRLAQLLAALAVVLADSGPAGPSAVGFALTLTADAATLESVRALAATAGVDSHPEALPSALGLATPKPLR